MSDDPHANQPLLTAGPPVERADAVVVMLHGRGASAQSILELHAELNLPTVAALAPQAAGYTWYPLSFLAPIEANQPYLDSALRRVAAIVDGLVKQGIASDKTAILGFSQGACLATEFVARHPRRYGALIALTGGLIGPPGTKFKYSGSLARTPAFFGTSDPDPHVPLERVEESAAMMKRMGAEVDVRVFPGMPHTINEEELEIARSLLKRISTQPPSR